MKLSEGQKNESTRQNRTALARVRKAIENWNKDNKDSRYTMIGTYADHGEVNIQLGYSDEGVYDHFIKFIGRIYEDGIVIHAFGSSSTVDDDEAEKGFEIIRAIVEGINAKAKGVMKIKNFTPPPPIKRRAKII